MEDRRFSAPHPWHVEQYKLHSESLKGRENPGRRERRTGRGRCTGKVTGATPNKTGEGVVHLSVDDYGNGVVGAYNRKGKGRTLKPGP